MSNRSRHRRRSVERAWKAYREAAAKAERDLASARRIVEATMNSVLEEKFPNVAKDYRIELKEPEEL